MTVNTKFTSYINVVNICLFCYRTHFCEQRNVCIIYGLPSMINWFNYDCFSLKMNRSVHIYTVVSKHCTLKCIHQQLGELNRNYSVHNCRILFERRIYTYWPIILYNQVKLNTVKSGHLGVPQKYWTKWACHVTTYKGLSTSDIKQGYVNLCNT